MLTKAPGENAGSRAGRSYYENRLAYFMQHFVAFSAFVLLLLLLDRVNPSPDAFVASKNCLHPVRANSEKWF